jgi:hypothetical protein
MTTNDPMDPVNIRILDLLNERIGLRRIAIALGMSHVAVRNRVLKALVPAGLVIKDATGNYQIIRANLRAFMKAGNQTRNQKHVFERKGSDTNSRNDFSGSHVNSPDQVGAEKVTSQDFQDPFPGKTRVHRLRYKIPLKSYLDPEQFNLQASLKDHQANIVQMANWKRIDITFRNFRVMITTKNCFIYGIQATGSHLEETVDVQDRAWQLVEPDLEKLESSLMKRNPRIKFKRDSKGIIVAEIVTLEIADEQDHGAIYKLRDRSYYVVREPHTGKRKFVLDKSTGLAEVEAVDPVTGIIDYENFQKFKMGLGPIAYDNLMLAVSNGYDPIKENIMLRLEIKGILDVFKQQKENIDNLIKDHSVSQGEIDQLREMLKKTLEFIKDQK